MHHVSQVNEAIQLHSGKLSLGKSKFAHKKSNFLEAECLKFLLIVHELPQEDTEEVVIFVFELL